MTQTIALGADHGGFHDKAALCLHLKSKGFRVIDMGASHAQPSDYPVFGFRVAEAVSQGRADFGVLLCRSGNGMAMAANRVRGVRAAIANNIELAKAAREHNDANVLVMGSDHMDGNSVQQVLEAFLSAKAEGDRHARRVAIINQYDQTLSSTLATHQLAACGQSPWIDDISDEMIASGTLKNMVERDGVRGLTSNPSIFEKAIVGGKGRYPGELAKLRAAGASAEAAYEKLTTEDIAAAADILRPLYDSTGGDDGYVSLEVLPAYAHDEETSVKEAQRLFAVLARPNVMIKVPGTKEGIRAFRRLTAAGVNVNVTLIFSRAYYNEIARAYIEGLRDRVKAGGYVSRDRSVASVFVSRIDTAVDKRLIQLNKPETTEPLMRRAAIANTKLIYQDFKTLFYGDEFADLTERGAAPQRPLWGSTSAKDPALRDTIYVEELVGALTVNTIPTATFNALLDHGKIRANAIEEDLEGAKRLLASLASLGLDLEAVCADLQTAGIKSFADSFDQLFATIKKALA